MKKVAGFLFLASIAVFSVNAAAPPLDTTAAAISPNVLESGDWYTDIYKSVIDTTGGLILTDSGIEVVKIHVDKRAKYDTTIGGELTTDYPWTTLVCDFSADTNFVGATALRITYKSDQPWIVSLQDSTNDQATYGLFGKTIGTAPDWTTIYLNLLDTTRTGFRRVWADNPATAPLINYSLATGLFFDPYTSDDEQVISTLEISDLRIFNYGGFKSPVKFAVSKAGHFSGSMRLTRSNMLAFTVPQTSTYSVSLYSPAGKQVLRMSKPCVKDGQNEISLKNFNVTPGVYIAKISQTDYSSIGKVIIK